MNRKLAALRGPVAVIEEERSISPQDLKLLAEPTREFIFNALVGQARTATELAQQMDCPTTRLYHHLRLLEKHRLIVVVAERLVSGIVERRYRAVARRLRLDRTAFGAGAGDERLQTILSYVFDQARTDIGRSHAAGLIDLTLKPPAPKAPDGLSARTETERGGSRSSDRATACLVCEYEGLSEQTLPDNGEFVGLMLAAYPTELRAADLPKQRGTRPAKRELRR